MAEYELKAGIKVEDGGLQQTVNRVVQGASRMENSLRKISPSTTLATRTVIDFNRVLQDLPYGFVGIANNIEPLRESFQRLKTETGSAKAAFSAMGAQIMGPAGIGIAFSVVSAIILKFGDRIFGASQKVKEAATAADKFKSAVDGIFQSVAKEAAEVSSLIGLLKNETETRERKLAAIKQLQDINPDVFSGLRVEGGLVAGLDKAYSEYLKTLKTVITVKIKLLQLENIIKRILELEGTTLTASQREQVGILQQINEKYKEAAKLGDTRAAQQLEGTYQSKKEAEGQQELNTLRKDAVSLEGEISELSKGVQVTVDSTVKKTKDWTNELMRLRGLLWEISQEQKNVFTPTEDPRAGEPHQDRLSEGIEKGLFEKSSIKRGALTTAQEMNNALLTKFGPLFRAFRKQVSASWIDPKLAPSTNEANLNKRLMGAALEFTAINEAVDATTQNFNEFIDAVMRGENAFAAFGDFVKDTLKDIIAQLLKTVATAALLSFAHGGATGFDKRFIGNLIGGGRGLASPGNIAGMLGGGRMSMHHTFTGRLQGNDLALSVVRTQASWGRTL